MEKEVILQVKGIHKIFPGTKALSNVEFTLYKGEMHALVGENGAGKSTLMNIIDGIFPPNAGKILINNKSVEIKNPHEAQKLGIGFVHQEIALCPHVTVAENIFMSSINDNVFVNYKDLYKRAEEVLKPLNSEIKATAKVNTLSISEQQVVEIAKALILNCKVLILDEPTSSLTESEVKALFKITRELKKQGIGIIYISHRMDEVFSQCDRVSVLRDGFYVGTYDIEKTTSEKIVNTMVGREIKDIYPKKNKTINRAKDPIFEIRNFTDGKYFNNINLKVFKGEVLGLFGLIGSGRSQLAQAVCALRPKIKGEVLYNNKKIHIKSAENSIEQRIVYLTEDRKESGLFLPLSIKKNISAAKIKNISNFGFLNEQKEIEQGKEYIKKLGIRCVSEEQRTFSLSGGNQQKVLFSKLLTTNPRVIFLDEPTRGIDVGAKSEIHKLIRNLANEDVCIIIISSELPEIIGMCDRVIIMREGNKCGEVLGEDINETKIIHLASSIN